MVRYYFLNWSFTFFTKRPPMKKESMKSTRNMKKIIFAISIAVPATLVKPSRPATSAITRNIIVHLSINFFG